MQKSGIGLTVSGVLIVVGLILLVLGNQVILEGISQGNGKVNLTKTLTISADFDTQKTVGGVFAVQIAEFRENVFFATVLDPLDIAIVSQIIDEETIENRFDVLENGIYKLIIESTSDEETQVFGAIGPIQDEGWKLLGFISVFVLVIGMIGLVTVGIYEIKRRRSI